MLYCLVLSVIRSALIHTNALLHKPKQNTPERVTITHDKNKYVNMT